MLHLPFYSRFGHCVTSVFKLKWIPPFHKAASLGYKRLFREKKKILCHLWNRKIYSLLTGDMDMFAKSLYLINTWVCLALSEIHMFVSKL